MCAEICINKSILIKLLFKYMSDFNKHRSFTKYYIINGTTADHQSIHSWKQRLACNNVDENSPEQYFAAQLLILFLVVNKIVQLNNAEQYC